MTSQVRCRGTALPLVAAFVVLSGTCIHAQGIEGMFVDLTNEFSVDVNDSNFEWGAALSHDGLSLFFSSDRSGRWDIYEAKRTSRDEPFGERVALAEINSSLNDHVGSVTPDGLTIYFESSRGGGQGGMDMWVATREDVGQQFGMPINFLVLHPDSLVNTQWDDVSPRISSDGLMLVFASDRNDGRGRQDIYVTTRTSTDEPFGAAMNVDSFLGSTEVNSPVDDSRPALSDDGLVLFFSELGEPFVPGLAEFRGECGVDLWVSTRASVDEPFGMPVNLNEFSLGPPVNECEFTQPQTHFDASPFISADWPADGSELYFVRNQRGTNGELDLWRATWISGPPQADFTVDPPGGAAPITVEVDATGSKVGEGHTLTYEWDFGDGTTAMGSTASHTYERLGLYSLLLTITDDRNLTATATQLVTITGEGLPASWLSEDVGEPVVSGLASIEEGNLRVFGGGTRLSGSADEFHFAYQELTGDTVIAARISELIPSGAPADSEAGIALRQELTPDAAHVSMMAAHDGTSTEFILRYREAAGETGSRTRGSDVVLPDGWVRIERQQNTFISSTSTDGKTWKELDTVEIAGAPATMHAGVAVAAGATRGGSFVAQATFSDLTIDGESVVQVDNGEPEFLRGDCDGNGTVGGSPTEAVVLLNFAFRGGAAPGCLAACDAEANGAIGITDALRILRHSFLGVGEPDPPFPECGPGTAPTDANLGCETPPANCQ